ncbi:MAG TPA: hypothetical protein ENJ95_14230 [Bacteroidetes bacterium]|nr:hypothetical protein [Bacteroidota bacterium]
MSNSTLIAADHKSMVLIDSKSNDNRLSIGRRGVLLSVLGNDICASEVPAKLDNYIRNALKGKKHFYEFEVRDAEKNQLCVTYNEGSNTVFIIGITDVIAELSVPTQIASEKIKTFAVKLKNKPNEGLTSNAVILSRLEFKKSLGSKKFIRFYYIKEDNL